MRNLDSNSLGYAREFDRIESQVTIFFMFSSSYYPETIKTTRTFYPETVHVKKESIEKLKIATVVQRHLPMQTWKV